MSKQYFSIQQLRFNIGFSRKEKGYELQNRISRLYHQQLHRLLNDFFYKTVPENTLIRKDSLVLDLGSLSYNELETALPERLEKVLAAQFPLLAGEKNERPATENFESVPAEAGYETLLEFFLNTGTLPWQAALQPHLTWQVMLQELYQHDRDALGGLLYKLGHSQPARIRLAFQSTEEDMQRIITAIEPVEAPFILAYKNKIAAIQQEKQLVRSDAAGFRQAVAYFILTYLLEEKESLFSKRSFIKNVLYQMAAHYNISFTGLLEVLYEALPVAIPSAQSSDSLFALVQALFMESRSAVTPALNTNSPGNPPLLLTDNGEEALASATGPLALLEFFLVTGQLPKQATAKGVFTWRAVLDELYKRDRDALNMLLRRLGSAHTVRKRMAYQFTEEALQKVFEVIEPVEAPAIIIYKKNIVHIQYKQQLVTVAGSDLRRAVSFFILTYLLEERGSVFSKRMFIKSVLRQMADHYNTAYADLLAVLYEAVPAGKIADVQQASFFQTIQDIYREQQFALVTTSGTFAAGKTKQAAQLADKISIISYYLEHGTLPARAPSFSREEIGAWLAELIGAVPATVKEMLVALCRTTAAVGRLATLVTQPFIQTQLPFLQQAYKEHPLQDTAHAFRSIPDVLYYFLQYGAMPWWAKGKNNQSPEALLQQLYAHSVEGVLQVLKRAGMQERSKQRFVWQFPEPLLYKVFGHLPEWDKAIAIVERTIQFIEAIPAFGHVTQQSLKYVLLDALWSSYIAHGYNAFDETHFYTLVFEHLAYLTTIAREEVVHLFREVVNREKEALIHAGNHEALGYFEQAIGLYSAGNTVIPGTPVAMVTGNMQHSSLDSLVRKYAGANATPYGEDRHLQVINILEYYLTWNRFPDSLLTLGRQEQDRHLEEMLLLLYHENREALQRILHGGKHSVTARMHLHHLFTAGKGGDHKQVSLLLDAYLEKDALQYIKEMAGDSSIANEAGLKQALDQLLEKAKAGTGEGIPLMLQSASLTSYIVRQYDNETVQWLIENRPGIDKHISRQAAGIRALLGGLVTGAAEKNRLLMLLNEAMLLAAAGAGRLTTIQEYIHALFRFLSRSTSIELLSDLLRSIRAGVNLPAVDAALIQLVRQELERYLQQREDEEALKNKLEAAARKKEEETNKALRRKLQQELQKQKEQEEQAARQKQPPPADKADKLYIANAGLVLLHPFLSTYFTRLNLMEKGQFVNREAQARAVHLLQYLAYSTTEHPEHELVLNKILCNYPLHEPLPLDITPDPQEVDLSAELLQVVIQRSGKLSNSTVDGFRVSFLHREGMLTEIEEAWTLRVEQRGYDMILQMLPWAFGMIRFSWMDKPLHVEWM